MSVIAFCTMRQLLFAAEILLCEGAFIYGYGRRRGFALRLALAVAATMVVAAGMGHVMALVISNLSGTGNYVLFSCLGYFSVFAISVGGLYLSFDIRLRQLGFCMVAGYCMRHLIFSCYILLISTAIPQFNLLRIEYVGWAAVGIYVGVYALLYALFFLLFARPISRSRDYIFSRTVLLMFAAVLVVNVIINTVSEVYSQEHSQLYINGLLVQIVCMLMVLFVQTLLLDRLQLEGEKGIVTNMLEQQEKQFKFAEANAELLSIKAHDLKHQVAVLRAGGDEAERLLRSIEDVTGAYDAVIKTDNSTVNVVISEKWMYCQAHGIKLSCMVNPKALDFMEKTDIYSLLGNILDNCIEAVEKLDSPDRRVVTLNIASRTGVTTIASRNYFDGQIALKDGLPITTKTDKISHGYGTRSIKRIVERYGGTLDISADEGVFCARITFSSN